MNIEKLDIEGLAIITLKKFQDKRGYFFEAFNEEEFRGKVSDVSFVQDNVSYSNYNIFRGLHYQLPPFEQGKYVQVLRGRVLDIAVDLRQSSRTFLEHVCVELSEDNGKAFYIPPGFAHGFLVLSSEAYFMYKVTKYYAPHFERCLNWRDPALTIDLGKIAPNMSDKDSHAPLFSDLKDELTF